ncbi:3'(2'),5'-bisphosphate nucleotidase [Ranunculus cassubicifolius]
MAGIVVVFDFDKTIIDCDSDNHVLDDFGATDSFNQLLLTMPWNNAMDTMMKELHSQGRIIEEIEDSLKRVPVDPKAISAIKSAHALGCDLRIVSDANTFFIETILKYHGLLDYFSEINTNPGFVDEEGRLRIKPCHDFTGCSHDSCPPNMCKGLIIERIKDSALTQGYKRFIYLGDGKGDFCPITKFREEDYVMPRKNYPVWELVCSNPSLIKAEIQEWSNWDDQEKILLQLIARIIYSGEVPSTLISRDHHFEMISISAPRLLKLAV